MSDRERMPHVEYDREHDVLYVTFGVPRAGYGEPDDELDNLIIRYDDQDRLMGFTVWAYSRTNPEELRHRLRRVLVPDRELVLP